MTPDPDRAVRTPCPIIHEADESCEYCDDPQQFYDEAHEMNSAAAAAAVPPREALDTEVIHQRWDGCEAATCYGTARDYAMRDLLADVRALLVEVERLRAVRDAAPASPLRELVEAAEEAATFLGSVEWNDTSSEIDAANVRHQLEDAIERPQDKYPWGETMKQYAALGIGVEAWVELEDIERRGYQQRNNAKSGMSISWGTFMLLMRVLRAIRISDFQEVVEAGRTGPPLDPWQPIETAPREEEVFFWVVPKRADEAFVDTSGNPIFSTHKPYLHRGKSRTWGALSKATHWMPLPQPPAVPQGGETNR